MNARKMAYRTQRKGMILFVVSLVLAILVIGGMALMYLMRSERNTTGLRSREIQLENAVRSGIVLMQATGELTPNQRVKYGGIYDNPKYFRAVELLKESEGSSENVYFTIVSPIFTRSQIDGIRYGLVNESSRLNLQAVLQWDRENPGTGRRTLMKLPGMTPNLADSILDWIDSDEKTRPNGAEADYYSAQALPYQPRNALPVFLEELLLVRGVTRKILYGSDESFNYDGAGETGEQKSAPTGPIPWSQILTVFSAEKDVDPQGRPRIDLNEKNLDFLHKELTRFTNKATADFVIRYRQYGPATALQIDTKLSPGASVPSVPDLTVSAKFSMSTPLDILGASILLPNGSVAKSPFSEGRSIGSDFLKYLDSVSTATSTVITGRVNINEAPIPVLQAIPGLTGGDIQRIISLRPKSGQQATGVFRHAIWLYSEGVVSLATMKTLWPKVTTGGDVFRGQVIGFIDGQGANVRAEVAIDCSVQPPRQVFYKNLTMYGRGFSPSILRGETAPESSFGGSLALPGQETESPPAFNAMPTDADAEPPSSDFVPANNIF